MPARPESIEIKMQLTEEQHKALVEAAKAEGVPVTVYMRRTFGEKIKGFPADNFIKPGTYKRDKKKKANP